MLFFMKQRLVVLLLFLIGMSNAFAWNSIGHRLIAQIAYDKLSPDAKRMVNRYNRALDHSFASRSMVNASVWLDYHREEPEWRKYHYIDLPFSPDNTPFKPAAIPNALTAIETAIKTLQNSQANDAEKGLQLRILLHVVGDIHQPLHAISCYSQRFPHGDKGGNLFYLAKNPIGHNLHAYWDRGGGLLQNSSTKRKGLKRRARYLERHYPCPEGFTTPIEWANVSHELAIHKGYTLALGQKPSKAYQRDVKNISRQQIVLAGCRLAQVLNSMPVD